MESITKIVIIDGQPVEFPRLSITDLFSLSDTIKATKEAQAKALAKEMSLSSYETYNVILEIRSSKPTVQELLANCSCPQGAVEVLNKSLAKTSLPKDQHKAILAAMTIPDCVDLARMMILDVQEQKQQEAKESPLPASPSTGAA